ncbi:MAG TPA: Asp-tRNA(Asn)/Glu-tRNA(Gln) amidotransferase subunit GatC [Microthrixaceae bacterium]|nr:Asp-tRNA(Asn)/Glu-tRNA(Gln) amidotransferase subunit GatC [Microthrixaceae bacterium]
MTERLTTAEVAKVAELARLRLTPEELERFTDQLAAVLDHAADIEALDLDGVEPLAHPVQLTNVMRDDEPGEVLDREEVLAQAPATEEGQFRVPPVLGEGA